MSASGSEKRRLMVVVRLLSGIDQLTAVNVPMDIHGSSRLPLEFEFVAYDGIPRNAYCKFLKGNKRGTWFYEEV